MLARHPLLHPVVVAAVVILVINDHVLKAAFPSWFTGKLSDLAGLIFFPALLGAIWDIAVPGGKTRPRIAVAAAASALVFALVQIWPPASTAYRYGLGLAQWPFHAALALAQGRNVPGWVTVQLTPDITDLITLPAVIVSVLLVRCPESSASHASGSAKKPTVN